MVYFVLSVFLVSGGQAHILGYAGRRRAMLVALWLLASVVLTTLFAEWTGVEHTSTQVVADHLSLIFLCTASVVALMLWLGPKWSRKRLAAADTGGRRFVALAVLQAPLLLAGAVLTFFADFALALSNAVW